MKKEKHLALYIDGENISAKKYPVIKKLVNKKGVLDCAKVYGRWNDNHTKAWNNIAKSTDNMENIRLFGKPKKNKVDDKIKKDMIGDMKTKSNVDTVVIASSDSDYVEVIKQLRAEGKYVIVIGEEKAPARLKEAANEFIKI